MMYSEIEQNNYISLGTCFRQCNAQIPELRPSISKALYNDDKSKIVYIFKDMLDVLEGRWGGVHFARRS